MKASRADMPVAVETMGVRIQQADWGEMTVGIESFPAGLETAPIFVGLPDDRCQCPHWGYVVSGQYRAIFADHELVLNAGDVYYLEPGHTTTFDEDTEIIEFSPLGAYAQTMEVAGRNVAAMANGAH